MIWGAARCRTADADADVAPWHRYLVEKQQPVDEFFTTECFLDYLSISPFMAWVMGMPCKQVPSFGFLRFGRLVRFLHLTRVRVFIQSHAGRVRIASDDALPRMLTTPASLCRPRCLIWSSKLCLVLRRSSSTSEG